MKPPTPSASPLDGRRPIRESGFSYLPNMLTKAEAAELGDYFATLHPVWEQRHSAAAIARGSRAGRLSRPVYWLGAWQFAALGYYAEPDHMHGRCVRAEPMPPVMTRVLERLTEERAAHDDLGPPPNTCLINYYGRHPKTASTPPVDAARLKMHRDAEPGAVVMFSIGQPAQFEFVMPGEATPQHSQWVRHRSVVILSGPEYKDRLYHRITRVRHGDTPVLGARLADFEVRRISVSFRHVPDAYIHDLGELDAESQETVRPYVEQLAEHSEHFRDQLTTIGSRSRC